MDSKVLTLETKLYHSSVQCRLPRNSADWRPRKLVSRSPMLMGWDYNSWEVPTSLPCIWKKFSLFSGGFKDDDQLRGSVARQCFVHANWQDYVQVSQKCSHQIRQRLVIKCSLTGALRYSPEVELTKKFFKNLLLGLTEYSICADETDMEASACIEVL